MSKEIIVLENICKSFKVGKNNLDILKNISLTIYAGDYVSIAGPSGAGKSTLLYLMGLLLSPDRGNIFIDGQKGSAINDREKSLIRNRKIGFIFQSYHLLPEFTACENVALPLILTGSSTKTANKKAMDLIEKASLTDRAEHYPSQLSGGEQQRISILRALINRPAVILADEPTGNLDSANSGIIMQMLKKFTIEAGLSLIMVTHNRELAEEASVKLRMKDGCLIS